MKPLSLRLLFGTFWLVSMVRAQEVQLGADVVSRYIWRETDFGESMSVQPSLNLSLGSLTIGTWASYAISTPGAFANEHDFYLSLNLGTISVGVTDYYFPAPGKSKFFNFEDQGEGAHYLEPFIQINGSEAVPFSLFAGIFAYNDPDYSIYLEAQYPFAVNGGIWG